MNFKKTLGLVLTAALVSTSLVAVKPAKAAAPTANAPITVTASANALTGFNYFFGQRSLLLEGESDSYVVDTNYDGKVQYELWVKKADDPNAKWQVISVNSDGKIGYTDAVDGKNSPYAIPLKSGFTFQKGYYYTGIYAKVAGTDGKKSYGHFIDANGVDTTDHKNGTEQKYDIVKTAHYNAMSQDYKAKYNEMLGKFLFDDDSFTVGKKATFKGFASQKDGAKYKFVVRKCGADISTQKVINSDFASTVDWTPDSAGTYQIIAWSAPDVNKGAARDGWASEVVTVKDAQVQSKLSVTKVPDFNPFMGVQDVTVNDSSLVSKVLINGTETKFTAPNATTVRLVLSDEPTSIVLVDAQGNKITAKGSDTPTPVAKTLTVTKVPDFNPFMGVQSVTVNDSSLVSKVLVNGTDTKFSAPDATTIRLVLSDEPTSIVLVDAQGNKVTAK